MNYHLIEYEKSFGTADQLPSSDMPEIAFAGRSNVGKSSLINKLFNQKQLARVSSMPGKTTTINFFRLQKIRFADLPGYGYAKVSQGEKKRWAKLMEHYFNSDRNLELVILLLDIRHAPTSDDLSMVNFLIEAEYPFIIALTKKDKLTPNEFARRMEALQSEVPCAGEITMIPLSAKTGEGIEVLKALIDELAQELAVDANDE